MRGKVYLVGAGPGDPGLLTLKGRECLRRADVVIYDRLAHPDLLNHCKADVQKVFAGKEASHHTLKQDEVNTIIVETARNGKTVCRLKGGDPFVLGRGGEEAEACANAGLDFEIVPGVISAIAVPVYAGIPVTHRDVSSSFAVIAAHKHAECSEPGTRASVEIEDRRDWAKIANSADTLIFLMGVENLEEIASQLILNGREPKT